ncbi:MAG: GNAT family N-acetyltransferase [Candidatus Binatales bacterium]
MGNGHIRIERVQSRESLEEFARLPFRVYADREAWWPPDVQHEIDLLSGRTPLSSFLELMPLLARRDGHPMARVSAVVNHRYNQHWNERIGQLIHFEAVAGADEAVAAMLEEAAAWLRNRAMTAARSGFAAFLDYPYAIDGYGEFPSFLLRGNPDYYHRLFKNAGFETEKGMLDYSAELTPELLARYRSAIEAAEAAGVRIRSWREYGFPATVDAWTDVTNAAFARHWGWNPVTRAESRPMLMPLGETAVADLSMVASEGGEPIGAVFSVPDFSATLAQVRPGAHIAPERGGGSRGALINIGVLEKARSRGVGLAMAARSFLAMAARGMRYAGYTLVLDDNWASRRTAERLGARVTGNFVAYRRNL